MTGMRLSRGLLAASTVLTTALLFGMPQTVAAKTATSETSPQVAKTEDDIIVIGRLIATGAESATKQNVSTLDTPFSVSAYTGDFLKTIHTTQVADLYRYMTGLQKAGNTGYDLTLRGFSTTDSDRNTILVDGLPGLAVRFGSPPTVGTDHVEVVKGAASLLYGAVQPGGFVNMVSKKPQAVPAVELSVRGTLPGASKASRLLGGDLSLDATGPLTSDTSLLYRFVGQVSDDTSFRFNAYERGFYLSPSLTWLPGPNTSVTAQVEYRQIASNYASLYLLAPRRNPVASDISYLADIRTNYMSPVDYLHEDGLIESLFVEHRFSDSVKWNFSFRNVDHHDSADAFDIVRYDRTDPTFNTLTLRARGQRNRRTYVFGDTYFTFHFDALGDHRMIVGASLGHEIDDFNRTKYCAINSPDAPNADATCNPTTAKYTISVSNPDFTNIPKFDTWGAGTTTPGNRTRNRVDGWGSGFYVSDLIGFGDHFKMSLGLRYAREHQTNFADANQTTPQAGDATLDSEAVLPQAGIIYQPSKRLSFYASYSTSFSPVPPGTQDALTGSYEFQPTRGKGYEVGAKMELPGHAATLTAALFRIDQTNVIVASSISTCSTGSCSEQIGAARSEGLEIEGTANPVPGWTVIAGCAYTDARITENAKSALSGPLPGSELPNSPKNAAHIFTRYDFSNGPLTGFGLGGGLAVVSDRLAYSATAAGSSFVLPAYQVVDLGFYYSSKLFDATIKVNNLFNTVYYSSGIITQGKVNVTPGAPRTFLLSLSHKF